MAAPRRESPASSPQPLPAAQAHPAPQRESPQPLVIVTGSTLAAETRDRPLAYRLRERVLAWLDAHASDDHTLNGSAVLEPIVCSDLWYLNDRELAERPAIAIGEPGCNAATSLISSRVPTAFVIEGAFRVHMDPEYIDLRAALWGINAASTAAAIDLFVERYMAEFLAAAM